MAMELAPECQSGGIMRRKIFVGLPYYYIPVNAPFLHGGIAGFQMDKKPSTDRPMLEIVFEDGRYDPTSLVLHDEEE
jgi:hypothetical protein